MQKWGRAIVVLFTLMGWQARADDGGVAGADGSTVSEPAKPAAFAPDPVSVDELRQVPGTLGDLGKSLESLPGVARLAGGEPIVWGANPEATRVLVDGVEVPALFHMGGFRSVVGGGMIDSLGLSRGGFGADLGRALGGVVELQTRSPPLHGVWGDLDANVFDASFAAGAGSEGGGIVLAGRSSYLGRLTNQVPSDTFWETYSLRYRDLQAKARFALRNGETLELISLYSTDYAGTIDGLMFPIREQSFLRIGARYTHHFFGGGSLSVTPFVGTENSRATWRTNYYGQPSSIDQSTSHSGKTAGLRASYRRPITQSITAGLGFDGLVTWSDLSQYGPGYGPAREGDITYWGAPSGCCGFGKDNWSVAIGNLAPIVSLEIALGKWLLSPSFRADGEFISGDRSVQVDGSQPRVRDSRVFVAPAPRLFVAHQSASWMRNHLALGLYHQAPSPVDLSSGFGSPTLGLSHALHVLAGTMVALVPGLTVEGSIFYRRLWSLVTRNSNPSPPIGQALGQDGQGRAIGAEVLFHVASRSIFSGWLSYTFSRSQRRTSADAAYRLFDYDQPHVLSAVGMVAYAGFSLGARLRVASGMPRTPVTGTYFTNMANYQPIFGAQNSDRLPVFCALDLRLAKTFHAKRLNVTPYLEGINLTNYKNAEDYGYSSDFMRRSVVQGLPRTVVVGTTVAF